MATLAMSGASSGPEPENEAILARHAGDAAIVTPWSYGFGENGGSDLKPYIYTDRPVYRPGHTVYIKGVIRKQVGYRLDLPGDPTLQLKITHSGNKAGPTKT